MKRSNMIGPALVFLIIIFSFFKLEGFVNPLRGMLEEIESIGFVNTIGIDKEDSYGKLKVTISYPDYRLGSGDSKTSDMENAILSAEGETVFDAHRNLHLLTSKKLSYGHVNYIILGEKQVSDGLENSLDFQMRDYERGWFAKVIIIKDVTAEQFIADISKKDSTVEKQIEGISQSAENLSITDEAKLYEIYDNLKKKKQHFVYLFLH